MKKILIIGLALILSYSAKSQFVFRKNIEPENVFLSKFIINKTPFKQKIASSYYVSGLTKENELILYLTCRNDNVVIKGKHGACFILIPKGLKVDKEKIKILFLNTDHKIIEAASIPNLEDLVYNLVKLLPGASLVDDWVEFFAKKLGVGKLERENRMKSLLNKEYFNGIGLKWDSQYSNGQWINAHYIKLEIPFYNNNHEVEKIISQNGLGLFYYFQSSVINNSSGVYVEIAGTGNSIY